MSRRIQFMCAEISDVTMQEALDEVIRLADGHNDAFVVTPNVDHMVRLERDPRLREAYSQAELVLADGQPLVWLSKLYRRPIREKVSGSDLFPLLCQRAAREGKSIFIFGAAEGVAERAAHRLAEQYAGLNICGTYAPPFGFENDEQQLALSLEQIKKAAPDILIVCLGCPKQEYFISQHRHTLGVPVSLCLGSVADIAAGEITRAPRWMSRCGLEWFYRLCSDPKRLAKRYLRDDLRIIPMFFKYLRKNQK
ncbi:MAG: WecB/TagA/CpsF family glycosyltransferase [Ruminococcaceae bacterium]|nr:WecB/TagA/CpsF family glycosyltransferase [Oscillospiraceae bacterium]